jgi:hypothetical protein
MYSRLSGLIQRANALTIFHPEDEAGFFSGVLDLGQVMADKAVGTAGDAEGAEGDLFHLVAWDAGADGQLVEDGDGFLSGQVNELSGEGAPIVVNLAEVRVGIVEGKEVGELEAVLQGRGYRCMSLLFFFSKFIEKHFSPFIIIYIGVRKSVVPFVLNR